MPAARSSTSRRSVHVKPAKIRVSVPAAFGQRHVLKSITPIMSEERREAANADLQERYSRNSPPSFLMLKCAQILYHRNVSPAKGHFRWI